MAEKLFRPDPQQRAVPSTNLERRIMALFNQPFPVSLNDIHAKINAISPEPVKACLNKLARQGKITRLVNEGKLFYRQACEVDYV